MLNRLTEWLFPARCLFCEAPLEGGEVACPGCLHDLPWWDSGAVPFPWGELWACWHYAFPIREVIVRCKYGGRPELARELGRLMAERLPEGMARPAAIVPVPLHPKRLKERGFNQSAEIAGPLAERLGVPLLTELTLRVRNTPPQAGLSGEARRQNLKGAFRVAGRVPGGRLLLLDDVATTGTTLSELAESLLLAGAEEIAALVCARA